MRAKVIKLNESHINKHIGKLEFDNGQALTFYIHHAGSV